MSRFVIEGKSYTGKTPETIARREFGRTVTVRKHSAVGAGVAYSIRSADRGVIAYGVFYTR